MQYICDAPGSKTWFRIETEGEAALESDVMGHVVEKHFRQAWEAATSTYRSTSSPFVEQNIGLKAHVQRVMPSSALQFPETPCKRTESAEG
jgi:hypothetical protein